MSDRIPFNINGSLAPWINTDHAIGVLGVAGNIIRVFGNVSDAPSGGVCSFDVRDATGGAGSGLSVSIADGDNYATTTGTVAITASETVYLRPTAANGALNLTGWFEFSSTGDAVTTFLTTLDRVKTDHGITGTSFDAQISRIIQGKSAAMQRWMMRTIPDTTYTDEVHSGDGFTNALALEHRPVTSTTTLVVKEDDNTVGSTLYTVNNAAGIIYLDSGAWTSGSRNFKVTYSAGWAAVPEDLAMACAAEVRHEFQQSQPSGTNRLGIESNADAAGGSTTYIPQRFLPLTLEIMRAYRRHI